MASAAVVATSATPSSASTTLSSTTSVLSAAELAAFPRTAALLASLCADDTPKAQQSHGTALAWQWSSDGLPSATASALAEVSCSPLEHTHACTHMHNEDSVSRVDTCMLCVTQADDAVKAAKRRYLRAHILSATVHNVLRTPHMYAHKQKRTTSCQLAVKH